MSWLVLDLVRQVRERLRPLNGGTGNAHGWSRGAIYEGFNATGSTLTEGTLVRATVNANLVESTTTDGETVLGVVVGYLTGDGGLVEGDAPDGGTVAVLTQGVVAVIVDTTVNRGATAFAAATDGQAREGTTIEPNAFGRFLEDATGGYPALVYLTGGSVSGSAAEHDIDGDSHIGFPGDDDTFLRADGEWATPSGADPWTTVQAASDEDVSSAGTGTTLQDDDELFTATLTSGKLYLFEMDLIIRNPVSTGGNFKMSFGEDNTGRGVYNGLGSNTSGNPVNQQQNCRLDQNTAWITVSTEYKNVHVVGWYIGNGNAAKLQWAQNTSSANVVRRYAGSVLRYRLVN